MSWRRSCLVSLAVMAFSPEGMADNTGLQRCAALAADSQRLACYDRLAFGPSAKARAAKTPVIAASISTDTPALEARTPADTATGFGAEGLPHRSSTSSADSIRSRVMGELEGWQKGDLFRLENGQIWKSLDDRRSFKRMRSPEVTVRRGLFGSYFLNFDGVNTQLRVRRIE